MTILYAYRLPGHIELKRDEMLERGFPDRYVTSRSGSQALRLAFSKDNTTPWRLTGKKRHWRLFDEAGQLACEISFEHAKSKPVLHWCESWCPVGTSGLDAHTTNTVRLSTSSKWSAFIEERVSHYLETVDRQNIQRSLERWLKAECNAQDEIIPSLHTIDTAFEPVLAAAYQALPEADWKFWRL